MARKLKNKELLNTRLASSYGGWMYCDKCNETIGYLCYATYDRLALKYTCKCGNVGSAFLDFEDSSAGADCNHELVVTRNRFCCPEDQNPLITILDKKLAAYEMNITCKSCHQTYKKTLK